MGKMLFTFLVVFICIVGNGHPEDSTKKSAINSDQLFYNQNNDKDKHYGCCGGFKSPVKAYDLDISVIKIKDNIFNKTIFEFAAKIYEELVNYDYSDGVSPVYVADKTLDLLKAYFAGCKKEMRSNSILNPESTLEYLSDLEIGDMEAFKDIRIKYIEVYEDALHYFLFNGNENRYKKVVEYNEKILSCIGVDQFHKLLYTESGVRTNLINMLVLSYRKAGKHNYFISSLLNEP